MSTTPTSYKLASDSSMKRAFYIEKDKQRYIDLTYQKLFSSQAEAWIGNDIYDIKPRNMWHKKFDFFRNGVDKGDIICNWKGDMIISFIDAHDNETNYLLKFKRQGVIKLKHQFILIDVNDKVVLKFICKANWKKVSYNYSIEKGMDTHHMPDQVIEELMLCCGYAINLYMSTRQSALIGAKPGV